MKLHELRDDALPQLWEKLKEMAGRDSLLKSDVRAIRVEANDTLVIELGDEFIFKPKLFRTDEK